MTTIRTEPPASRSRLHYTSRCEPEPCAAPPQDESGWSPEPVPRAAQVAVRQPGTVASGRREIPGAKTLSDARSFLGHFAIWPGEAALDTVALWAAHAHARGADGMLTWQASPRLLFSSAEPGAGKSYAMRLVARICPAPAVFTEPSEPAVAHAIGRDHATLALDEIDVLFGRGQRKAAIRAVINDGYTPDGSWARVRGGQVDRIPTFGALMLAGLDAVETATDGHLRALLTRCIRIRMRRGPEGWRAPRFDADGRTAAGIVTERLGQWAAQSLTGLRDYVPEVPEGIGCREAELWEPLLAVADMAGGRWPEAARAACEELTHAGAVPDDDSDNGAELDRILAGWGGEL